MRAWGRLYRSRAIHLLGSNLPNCTIRERGFQRCAEDVPLRVDGHAPVWEFGCAINLKYREVRLGPASIRRCQFKNQSCVRSVIVQDRAVDISGSVQGWRVQRTEGAGKSGIDSVEGPPSIGRLQLEDCATVDTRRAVRVSCCVYCEATLRSCAVAHVLEFVNRLIDPAVA